MVRQGRDDPEYELAKPTQKMVVQVSDILVVARDGPGMILFATHGDSYRLRALGPVTLRGFDSHSMPVNRAPSSRRRISFWSRLDASAPVLRS